MGDSEEDAELVDVPPAPLPPQRPLDRRRPMRAAEGADVRFRALRDDYPACLGPTDEGRLKAARGLHAAATRYFGKRDYDEAILRWREAYTYDCTAHRLLLNVAKAEERRGQTLRAWGLRNLYIERTGNRPPPEVAAAIARDVPVPPYEPNLTHATAELDTWLWPSGGGTSWGVAVSGFYRYTDVRFGLTVPIAAWFSGGELTEPFGPSRDAVRAGIGNPVLSVAYLYPWIEGAFAIGLRIGLPVASIEDVDWQQSVARAGAAAVWRHFDLWSAGAMPIGAQVRVDSRLLGPLFVDADLHATVYGPLSEIPGPFVSVRAPGLPPTPPGPPERETTVGVSVHGRVEMSLRFDIDEHQRAGAYLAPQLGYLRSTLTVDDQSQAGLEVGAMYRYDRFWSRLGFLASLDPPLGFAFESGGVSTIILRTGVVLDPA
ncbi:MAG: hypothetical protein AAGA56_28200, partial [Myxococcota bacterium]